MENKMTTLEKISSVIAEDLDNFKKAYHKSLQSSNPLLQEIVAHVTKSSGKMMRPILVMLTAKLSGGITEKTIKSAVALELLHVASLIHDDVVDNSAERRGLPSVMAEFKNKAAVLGGDFFLSTALCEAVATNSIDVVGTISSLGRTLIDGELLQLSESRNHSFKVENYYSIIKNKTAALFSASSRLGALSVENVDAENIEKLTKLGENIGICFQIKDDIFDFQPDNKTGKPFGNDIQEGKITLPLLYVYNNATEEEKQYINECIVANNVEKIVQIVNEKGGIEYANSELNKYYNEAQKILEDYPASPVKEALTLYIEYLLSRKK
jgi:octaprenyl-diphosphate synthase